MDGVSGTPAFANYDASIAVAASVLATAEAQQVVQAATLFASLGIGSTVDASA